MSVLTEQQFLRDVAGHAMTVIRDDGIYRHVRFKRPNTICMHFDLITWPGYLCYSGDMGHYVFSRLRDMFEFFRTDRTYARPEGKRLAINLSYWAEKLEAIDRNGKAQEFSVEKFSANVMRYIEQCGLTGKLGHGLRDNLEAEVLSQAEYGEEAAYRAALDFEYQGKSVFRDFWEVDSREWTHRFVWCCYALAWGIEKYDERMNAAALSAGAEVSA